MVLAIFALAYGRVTDELSWKPFAILAAVAMLVAILFLGARSAYDIGYHFGGNYFAYCIAFLLGFGLGRWLDHDKYSR